MPNGKVHIHSSHLYPTVPHNKVRTNIQKYYDVRKSLSELSSFLGSIFQHYRLFEYLFTEEQSEVQVSLEVSSVGNAVKCYVHAFCKLAG